MIISNDLPVIKYAKRKIDFQYFRLFLTVTEPYIVEYKNVAFENLTEKDQSIALARIIKRMQVNGIAVTEFFKDYLAAINDRDNYIKNCMFVEFMAREIFGCYDLNRYLNGQFYKSPYLFCVVNGNKKDYFEVEKPKGEFKKPYLIDNFTINFVEIYQYYQYLKKHDKLGTLVKTPIYTE